MKIQNVTDAAFRKYGRVHEGYTLNEIQKEMQNTPLPQDVVYVASVEAFLVPAGTMVEMYATTLHYAPCGVGENGFRCVVVLPKDTNTDLEVPAGENGEYKLLTEKNKWLIAHEDAKIAGAFCGLKGENITLE